MQDPALVKLQASQQVGPAAGGTIHVNMRNHCRAGLHLLSPGVQLIFADIAGHDPAAQVCGKGAAWAGPDA